MHGTITIRAIGNISVISIYDMINDLH